MNEPPEKQEVKISVNGDVRGSIVIGNKNIITDPVPPDKKTDRSRIITVISSIATLCIALVALVPAFGQWVCPDCISGLVNKPTAVASSIRTDVPISEPTQENSLWTPTPEPFDDWTISHPTDVHKIVEFKRCEQYPNDGFPVFENDQPGRIFLKLNSAEEVEGKLTWCFQIRLSTPIDEWNRYIKETDSNYQDKNPEGIAVYFSANKSQPPGLEVFIDGKARLGLLPDGISFLTPRTIRVLLPIGATLEPVVDIGPYEEGATYIIR